MSTDALIYIKDLLNNAGIHYEFGEWKGDIVYPYFVGEYQESAPINEDGLQEILFILNGFTRGPWLDLELAKEQIEKIDTATILPNGNGIAVMYSNSIVIPTGNSTLKRIQINLSIQEWRTHNG